VELLAYLGYNNFHGEKENQTSAFIGNVEHFLDFTILLNIMIEIF
jgi:hypothetical protein